MTKRKKEANNMLFKIGITMIILGIFVLLVAVASSGVKQSFVKVGTDVGSVEIGDVSPQIATMIATGAILIILGLIATMVAKKIGN